MLRDNYSFMSTDLETKLNAAIFSPEKKAIATLIIAHGIGEHIERYVELAQYLTQRGIIVAAYDCIGHGKSKSATKGPMYFGKEGSWEYLVKDLDVFCHIIREKYEKLPCYVLGFSMGSFVVRSALANRNLDASGVILAGTGRISQFTAKLVKFVVSLEAKRLGGDDKVSQKVNNLAFGNYNKYFKPCRTEFDWLCQNEDAIDEYMADSLTQKFITPGMFRELLSGIAYTSTSSAIGMIPKGIPVLFLSGEDDPVGEFKKGVEKVASEFGKNGVKTTLVVYPNVRHDIFHDSCKTAAMQNLYDWIVSIM